MGLIWGIYIVLLRKSGIIEEPIGGGGDAWLLDGRRMRPM